MSQKVRQEIHCHDCNQYVRFRLDMELNGNHVLKCPNCGHEHCRVVKDGKITDIRWASINGPTYSAYNITSSATSTYVVGGTAWTDATSTFYTSCSTSGGWTTS